MEGKENVRDLFISNTVLLSFVIKKELTVNMCTVVLAVLCFRLPFDNDTYNHALYSIQVFHSHFRLIHRT